ncbi:hypothetical protein QE429_001472 [Bacillus sp. SORGH_AS 510]|nr:hypothetical protein [Bacillus sp. SORGH_AS_0510]
MQLNVLWEYGSGETPQALFAEEARRNTHGKRSAWSGNQQACLTEPKQKETSLTHEDWFFLFMIGRLVQTFGNPFLYCYQPYLQYG